LPDSQLTAAHNPACCIILHEPQQQRDAAASDVGSSWAPRYVFWRFGSVLTWCIVAVFRRLGALANARCHPGATNTAVSNLQQLTVVLAVWASTNLEAQLLIANCSRPWCWARVPRNQRDRVQGKVREASCARPELPIQQCYDADIPTSTPIRAMRKSSLLSIRHDRPARAPHDRRDGISYG